MAIDKLTNWNGNTGGEHQIFGHGVAVSHEIWCGELSVHIYSLFIYTTTQFYAYYYTFIYFACVHYYTWIWRGVLSVQYYTLAHVWSTLLHIRSRVIYSTTYSLTLHIQYYTFTHISFTVLHIHPAYSRREPVNFDTAHFGCGATHSLTFHIQYYTFALVPLQITTRSLILLHIPIYILTNSLTFHIQYYTFTHLLYTVLHVHSPFILWVGATSNLMRHTLGAALHIHPRFIYNTTHSLTFHTQSYIFSHPSNSRREPCRIYITRSLTFHIQYYTFTHLSYTVLHIHSLSVHSTTHLLTCRIYNTRESLTFRYTVLHIHSFSTLSTWHSYIRSLIYVLTHPFSHIHAFSIDSPTNSLILHIQSYTFTLPVYSRREPRQIYVITHARTFHVQYCRFTHFSYTVLQIYSYFIHTVPNFCKCTTTHL